MWMTLSGADGVAREICDPLDSGYPARREM